jgi:hypothetical protein
MNETPQHVVDMAWQGPYLELLPAIADAGVYAFVAVDASGTRRLARVGATNNFLRRMAQYCECDRDIFTRNCPLEVFFAPLPINIKELIGPLLDGPFMRDLRSLEYRIEYLLFRTIRARNNGAIPPGNATSGSRTLDGQRRVYQDGLGLHEVPPIRVTDFALAEQSHWTDVLRKAGGRGEA